MVVFYFHSYLYRVAEPIVTDNPKCKDNLVQDQETCEFELPKGKCPKCKVVGWYTTILDDPELENVFQSVPEDGLTYSIP